MTLAEFVSLWTGQDVSFPNCQDNECTTLVHRYISEVLGIQDPTVLAQALAYEIWTNFNNVPGNQYFTQVANTPTNVPQAGNVVIFGQDAAGGVPDGHVCVFLQGDTNSFTSFDANWPVGSTPHVQTHDYTDVQGWLVPSGNLVTQDAVEATANDVQQLSTQLQTQTEATTNCLTQLKSITEQNATLQTQVTDLQAQLKDTQTQLGSVNSKYVAEQNEVVALNGTLETLSGTNKDYASQALESNQAVTALQNNLLKIAAAGDIKTTGLTYDQITNNILAQQEAEEKLAQNAHVSFQVLQELANEVVEKVESLNAVQLGSKIMAFIRQKKYSTPPSTVGEGGQNLFVKLGLWKTKT